MTEFVLKINYFVLLIQMLNTKFRERLLEWNLLHRIHASLWIILKENFLKANKFSPGFGLDILMIFFSAGRLVKKELGKLLNCLKSFTLIYGLLMNALEKVWTSLMSLLKFSKVNLLQTYIVSPQMDIRIFILAFATKVIRKYHLFIVKPSEGKEYAPGETTLLLIQINLRIGLEKGVTQKK